jgi:AraC-like DNA-binding protein
VTQVDLDPAWQQVVQRAGVLVQDDNYQKAVEEIEDFLIGLRLHILFDPKQVRTAAKLLYHTRGQFRVSELADYCHLSLRQLQRQFDQTTGVSPKALARAIRFESIRERLMFDPDTNLTDLAYEFGSQTRRASSRTSKLSRIKLRVNSHLRCSNSRIFSMKTRTSCFYNRRPPCLITMRASCSKQAGHKGNRR